MVDQHHSSNVQTDAHFSSFAGVFEDGSCSFNSTVFDEPEVRKDELCRTVPLASIDETSYVILGKIIRGFTEERKVSHLTNYIY